MVDDVTSRGELKNPDQHCFSPSPLRSCIDMFMLAFGLSVVRGCILIFHTTSSIAFKNMFEPYCAYL